MSGFWDGGRTWRVRFSPDEAGKWRYRTSSMPPDKGLNGKGGKFRAASYQGANPLYRHGPVRVSSNRYYLEHADGTPFFWLADTAWNGPLRSSAAGWEKYLEDRAAKGFNVVQFVATHWTAATCDGEGKRAFSGRERIEIDPEYYWRLDERMEALNEGGFLAAPVLLWSHKEEAHPVMGLPEDQAVVLARYLLARYGAHRVVWIVVGDGREGAPKWKRMGREIFSRAHPNQLAALHSPRGGWAEEEYLSEPWFAVNGYQSGHGGGEEAMRWLVAGPPAQAWKKPEHRPSINLEPCYEGHRDRSSGSTAVFSDHEVRRTMYWSLLVGPPAGVSYGAHGVWSWESAPAEPLSHPGTGIARPWREAIALPGSMAARHLRAIFEAVQWWRLRPAPETVVEQPGARDPARFVAVALTEDGAESLAYLPEGGSVELRSERAGQARWYDPRSGEASGATPFGAGVTRFSAPGPGDWVLRRSFRR